MKSKAAQALFLVLIATVSLLLWPPATLADSGVGYAEQEVGGFRVGLAFAEEPVTVGEAEIRVTLSDAEGRPVEGAEVYVTLQPRAKSSTGAQAEAEGHDAASSGDHGQSEADHAASTHEGSGSAGHAGPTSMALKAGSHVGEYAGRVRVSEPGEWILRAGFVVEGQEREAEFSVNVDRAGPNWAVLGGFAGVNAAAILAAAIQKRNPPEK